MPTPALVAVSTANRWLLVFTIAAVVVLAGGTILRRAARRGTASRSRARSARGNGARGNGGGTAADPPAVRGMRRRAGALIALGPLVGLALAPSPGTLTVVAATGAAVLAAVGAAAERSTRVDRVTMAATVVAAVAAVVAGARFGPTGVGTLDVVLAFLFVVVVTQAVDGLGNLDGFAAGIGAAAGGGLFAIAAFGAQDDLASVALGLGAACFAFLAFNLRPASLFVGRAGRLAIGFTLAVGALGVDPVPGPTRELVTPLILLGVLLLDVTVVGVDRLRRRRSLAVHRSDHLVHRLAALGWTAGEAVTLLVFAQVLLSLIALFTARAILPVWLGAAAGGLVVLLLAVEAGRGKLEREPARGFSRRVWVTVCVVAVALVVAVLPTALAARDAADLMLEGRDAASRGLAAARDGDTITAQGAFNQAARTFQSARDKLESPALSGGLAVPGVASNLRAARALAAIGTDLASAGESVAIAVRPEALEVVGGQLPLDEVARVTPVLEAGSRALTAALDRLDGVRDDPYLAGPIQDAVTEIDSQLVQAEREARRAADAARLAPALFGGNGPRRYLLVVQNNAESRATGGFIGSYGIITAESGKLTVGDLERTGKWNAALRELDTVTYTAPADYKNRYTQFLPETTLQNVNLSPDFPSVGQVLLDLAPQAGVGAVDGVIAVDPEGLAALLELTGPVEVPAWPTAIDASNVVDVTLRDAYAVYPEETADRVDFLGDVAHAAVDEATTGSLGKPAGIAKVLGDAAHRGHLILHFARPEEQQLAEQLDVAEKVRPVKSDAIAVTSSNAGGNKIDYYLQRSIDYRVLLEPDDRADAARATATLDVALDNTAPDQGLPQIVIGPFDDRFTAGQNRSLVSLYSPLSFESATMNGQATPISPGRERGRNVYSIFDDIPAKTAHTVSTQLGGDVELHDGWYMLEVRHQPTLNTDRVHVSVDVADGWKIDRAPRMERPFARRATTNVDLDRTTRFRVHVTRDLDPWSLWDRLEAGT